VSGSLLIWSIFTIKKFLNERNDDGQAINMPQLIMHSAAFGFFLISALFFEAA